MCGVCWFIYIEKLHYFFNIYKSTHNIWDVTKKDSFYFIVTSSILCSSLSQGALVIKNRNFETIKFSCSETAIYHLPCLKFSNRQGSYTEASEKPLCIYFLYDAWLMMYDLPYSILIILLRIKLICYSHSLANFMFEQWMTCDSFG